MTETFYQDLPRLTSFRALCEPDNFAPLPMDWSVGVSDVVNSRKAIDRGAYKSVNMVGAAVISAQMNAHGDRPFPYVFGGDGASFAVPPNAVDAAQSALRAVMGWSKRAYDLDLRGVLLPMRRIRAAGADVRVLRFGPSDVVDYAMFSGGGLSWAERELKAGRIGLLPDPDESEPNLSGLSCRWSNLKARNGKIVSLIVAPADGVAEDAFAQYCARLLALVAAVEKSGHPIPETGPPSSWSIGALRLEKAIKGRKWSHIMIENLAFWLSLKTGAKPGGFDGKAYARDVARNADFRKFDDGLKMTIDCDAVALERIKLSLTQAEQAGLVRFGLSEQDEAMMTCIVPSPYQNDHLHFVDGAEGGYAQAALTLKAGAV